MCGRYSLFVSPADLEERFGVDLNVDFEPRYNATPGQELPVIRDVAPSTLERHEWGLIPSWAGSRSDGGHINARAETLEAKPSFADAFEQDADGAGRCLVPADGFFEWVTEDGTKQPYRVTLTENEPFAMAGLWAEWKPPTQQTGLDAFSDDGDGMGEPDPVRTFAVVTTDPNELVSDLHHRMAVILDSDAEREWLEASTSRAESLLAPYPADTMRSYPVSQAVNDPANDSPAVVEPIDG